MIEICYTVYNNLKNVLILCENITHLSAFCYRVKPKSIVIITVKVKQWA